PPSHFGNLAPHFDLEVGAVEYTLRAAVTGAEVAPPIPLVAARDHGVGPGHERQADLRAVVGDEVVGMGVVVDIGDRVVNGWARVVKIDVRYDIGEPIAPEAGSRSAGSHAPVGANRHEAFHANPWADAPRLRLRVFAERPSLVGRRIAASF